MEVRSTDGSNGRWEFHAVNCKHNSSGWGEIIEVEATNMKELCHQLELWFNDDFAGDYGMTVEEYVAEGLGYQITTDKDSEFRVFPCCKF